MTERLVAALQKDVTAGFIEPMLEIPQVEKGELAMPGWRCTFRRDKVEEEDGPKTSDIASCTLWFQNGKRCVIRVPVYAVYPMYDRDSIVVDSFFLADGWKDMPAGYHTYIRKILDIWIGGLMGHN
jgi:hypothetical protein